MTDIGSIYNIGRGMKVERKEGEIDRGKFYGLIPLLTWRYITTWEKNS